MPLATGRPRLYDQRSLTAVSLVWRMLFSDFLLLYHEHDIFSRLMIACCLVCNIDLHASIHTYIFTYTVLALETTHEDNA